MCGTLSPLHIAHMYAWSPSSWNATHIWWYLWKIVCFEGTLNYYGSLLVKDARTILVSRDICRREFSYNHALKNIPILTNIALYHGWVHAFPVLYLTVAVLFFPCVSIALRCSSYDFLNKDEIMINSFTDWAIFTSTNLTYKVRKLLKSWPSIFVKMIKVVSKRL